MVTVKSAIYEGSVQHHRDREVEHRFTVPLYMLYLDLSELPELFDDYPGWTVNSTGIVRFDRSDHLGSDSETLQQSVRRVVNDRIGRRPEGAIRLLTQLRHFGYCFNPVSFYYCYDEDEQLNVVLAEVHNTPWHEEHVYVLDCSSGREEKDRIKFRFDKNFHVSPFLPMETYYRMRLTRPAEKLHVSVESHRKSRRIFRASLEMQRKSLARTNAYLHMLVHPTISLQVIGRIYFEAFRLWWKGATFHPHPEASNQ